MKESHSNTYYIIFIVLLLLISGMFISWHHFVEWKQNEATKMYNHYVLYPDSMASGMKVTKDSVTLESYLAHIDSISRVTIQKADNYTSDVDLMIEKSSAWMGFWIGIFAIVMTVPTIIQFIMAYRNDNEVKQMIDNGKRETALLENKLKCSIKEHRISSIMMCLSSIPDPQLTPSQEMKRSYVNNYIQFLAEEFGEYILLIKEYFNKAEKTDVTDNSVQRNNILMVVTMLKMSLIRTQCVFSDITQNIQYRLLQDQLDQLYQRIEKGEVWGSELVNLLHDIRKKMDVLIAALQVNC